MVYPIFLHGANREIGVPKPAAKRPLAEVKKLGSRQQRACYQALPFFGFGFKLALIGFGTGAFSLLLHPGIPQRLGINLHVEDTFIVKTA